MPRKPRPAPAALALALALAAAVPAAARPPRRIVTLAPSLTETVFALGAGARVVGVGDYDAFPPAVRALPRVGGLYDPNLEKIVALDPDLVLLPSPVPRLQALCAGRGVRTAIVPLDSLEDLDAGIARLGALLNRPRAAAALAARIHAGLERVRARTAGLRPARVLLVLDRPAAGPLRDIASAGAGSFLDQLLGIAGGRNVFHDVRRRYFTASLESIVARRPDVILELDAGGRGGPAAEAAARRRWAGLFTGGPPPRVRILTDPVFVVPGPRIALAAARLAAILHPPLRGGDAP